MSVKQGELDITLHLPNTSIWDQAIQCACAIYANEQKPAEIPTPFIPQETVVLYFLLVLIIVIFILNLLTLVEVTSLSIVLFRTMRQVDKAIYEAENFIRRRGSHFH